MAGSLLKAIGMPRARDPFACPIRGAGTGFGQVPGPPGLLKGQLAHNKTSTALFDTERFCRNVEAAFGRDVASERGRANNPPRSRSSWRRSKPQAKRLFDALKVRYEAHGGGEAFRKAPVMSSSIRGADLVVRALALAGIRKSSPCPATTSCRFSMPHSARVWACCTCAMRRQPCAWRMPGVD